MPRRTFHPATTSSPPSSIEAVWIKPCRNSGRGLSRRSRRS
jgi:hypothetical protein